jgi:hypothetical protein
MDALSRPCRHVGGSGLGEVARLGRTRSGALGTGVLEERAKLPAKLLGVFGSWDVACPSRGKSVQRSVPSTRTILVSTPINVRGFALSPRANPATDLCAMEFRDACG